MNQPDTTQLHQFLVDHFSLEELKTLCFNLGVEYEDLGGEGRAGKARELVLLMKRQTRLSRLDELLLGARPEAYREKFGRFIHEKTGIQFIRIPAGPFLYGSKGYAFEEPQRVIELPEFWISRYPVTNAEFARFVKVTKYQTEAERVGWSYKLIDGELRSIKGANWRNPKGPESLTSLKNNHPVVHVDWKDTKAFCKWSGLSLPAEVQWEKAARGNDGRIWPWGNEQPTAQHCNFNLNVGDTTEAGCYSPKGDSPYGCADMAGNVREWTGYQSFTLRGGSWENTAQNIRSAFRLNDISLSSSDVVGFRVVELLFESDF